MTSVMAPSVVPLTTTERPGRRALTWAAGSVRRQREKRLFTWAQESKVCGCWFFQKAAKASGSVRSGAGALPS